jgi:hypothetical protein
MFTTAKTLPNWERIFHFIESFRRTFGLELIISSGTLEIELVRLTYSTISPGKTMAC